jgi:hypothetical protein
VLRLFPERIQRREALDARVRLVLIGDLYFINYQSTIYYEVPGNTTSSTDDSEIFSYSKCYFYKAYQLMDYIYLRLYVAKKRIQIINKLFRHKQYKDMHVVMKGILRVR